MAVTGKVSIKNGLIYKNNTFPGMKFLACFAFFFHIAYSHALLNKEEKSLFASECSSSFPIGLTLVECNNVNVNDLTAMIEEEVKNFPEAQTTIDILRIEKVLSENGKLSQNWINTTSFRIKQLEIISSEFSSIDDNAFKGYAFDNLENLELKQLKIDTLQEGTFEGLKSLSILQLYNCDVKQIKENALKATPKLRFLTIISMGLPLNLKNLTGTVALPEFGNLLMLNNNVQKLDVETFSQISNVKSLIMEDCEIENIGCGTFQNMKSLSRLSLSSNYLTKIESCVFGEELIENLPTNTLNVGNNPWNCTCDLDWLKQLEIKGIIADKPRCASHSNLPFNEVNFCDRKK